MRFLPIKLYCIPYAGASASVYLSWKKMLDPYGIHIVPLELRGRGKRYDEKVYTTMNEAIQDIYDLLIFQQRNSSLPYALYGHSMGCTIVFELLHYLDRAKRPMPVHAFLSGRYPPHIVKSSKQIYLLQEEEFVKEIRNMGGTADIIIDDPTLRDIFFPIIKADYKILETYRYSPYEKKIPCPVTVVNGLEDNYVSYDEALMWQSYCDRISFKFLQGDHFFVRSNITEVANMIIDTLIKKD